MIKKLFPPNPTNLLIPFIFLISLVGCFSTGQGSDNVPIDDFIIGNWKVLEVIDATNGEKIEIRYPIVRIGAETMSYGDFLDSEYQFIDKDTILINHKRLIEKVVWVLEKDGESLIVHDKTLNRIITLERNYR